MPQKKKTTRRKAKTRQTKVHLVFNEEERREFLTGFRKRKNERRQKAREEIANVLKLERKQLKEKRRDMMSKMYYTNRDIPGYEQLVTPVIHDLPNHTVTVSSVTDIDFKGSNDLKLGQNTKEDESEDSKEGEVETNEEGELKRGSQKSGNLNHLMREHMIHQMKTSKVVSLQRRMQRKKDRQHAKRKKPILRKREKHKGKKRMTNS